ncbi:MAG TPA: protein YhfH [Bacillota bacterium]|nr:protein YhfH [Bacillota bacterium]
MIKSSSEFFRNLPDKCCVSCGHVVTELADCYIIKCDDCNGDHFFPIHPTN